MAITALPPPPSSADPSNFNARADAFLGALPTFATEANTLADDVNVAASSAAASAAAAASSQASAAASAAAAAASVAAANFMGVWSSLTGPLARPASVAHNGVIYLLQEDIADVTAATPGASSAWLAYQPSVAAPALINSNTAATPFGRYIFTAPCTLTLPASPAVGTTIQFVNLSGVLTCIVDPGGEKIRGTTGPMTLDDYSASATLTYSGATKGWI